MNLRQGFSTHTALLAGSAALLAVALPFGGRAGSQDLPVYSAPKGMVWLEQNWDDRQRAQFHNVSQGTVTLPIPASWFLALEDPAASLNPKLFSDPTYLDRFGFIPSPRDAANNPDGLPVGFARTTTTDPATGARVDQFGFTCAACHTGRIDYRGTTMLVDGGPAMTDLGKFREALAKSLIMAVLPTRFPRFAERVLGPGHSKEARDQLKKQVKATIDAGIKQKIQSLGKDDGSIEEGFGRLDALNRIGNEVFGSQMGNKANIAPLSAPVAYPHIWDTAWYDWVQYNSSIEQPMVRNAGEAMGVRALVNYRDGPTPRFTSTVPIDRLHAIEESLGGTVQPTEGRKFTGLQSPKWPVNILGPINRPLAEQGAALYDRHCKGCHLPRPDSDAFWDGPHWIAANPTGQRFLRTGAIPVAKVGTDEAQAADMKARNVLVPLVFGFTGQTGTKGSDGVYPFGPALGQAVEKVVTRWYDSHGTPAAERERLNGFRPNGIRDGLPAPRGPVLIYKARPLNGVWATAPFLHNGSVPTLWHLLSPYSERPQVFWLGNREFDPVKVGYVTGEIKGGFKLVAVKNNRMVRGNGNGGHLFETPADPANPRKGTIGPSLTEQERRALIEYLKSI